MYKKASQIKLRFETSKGLLNVEQLWGLKEAQLKELILDAKSKLVKVEDFKDLSFLDSISKEDELDRLRFDILVDIYKTKQEAVNKQKELQENKLYNAMIDEIIAEKQNESLKSLSVEGASKVEEIIQSSSYQWCEG